MWATGELHLRLKHPLIGSMRRRATIGHLPDRERHVAALESVAFDLHGERAARVETLLKAVTTPRLPAFFFNAASN